MLAEQALRALAALNLLLVGLLAAALLIASAGPAPAQAANACEGADMLAEMASSDPAALQGIREEAAKAENGGSLLWRIEAEGAAPSYLFGTMHTADPRVIDLAPAAEEAFDAADTLVIETTDALDQQKMLAALMSRPDLMMFTDETELFSLIAEEDRPMVEAALDERGIPPESVRKIKPWMLVAAFSLPACELARQEAGAPVLDDLLARKAQAEGKTLEGLETAVEQLEAMASLPMDVHVQGLVDTIRLGDRIEDLIETMTLIYLDGETGLFWPFFRAALPAKGPASHAGYAAFEEAVITERNHTMAERAVPYLDEGGAFIAVGALHLPGPEGVVALLREQGYAVEAVR